MTDDPVARLYAGLRRDEALAVAAVGRPRNDPARVQHDTETGPAATLWKVAGVRRAVDIATAAIAAADGDESEPMRFVLAEMLRALADIYPLGPADTEGPSKPLPR